MRLIAKKESWQIYFTTHTQRKRRFPLDGSCLVATKDTKWKKKRHAEAVSSYKLPACCRGGHTSAVSVRDVARLTLRRNLGLWVNHTALHRAGKGQDLAHGLWMELAEQQTCFFVAALSFLLKVNDTPIVDIHTGLSWFLGDG